MPATNQAQVKAELFLEAARSLGVGPLCVLSRYLRRNVITSVPVLLTLNAADAVLVLGLSFLGGGLENWLAGQSERSA